MRKNTVHLVVKSAYPWKPEKVKYGCAGMGKTPRNFRLGCGLEGFIAFPKAERCPTCSRAAVKIVKRFLKGEERP